MENVKLFDISYLLPCFKRKKKTFILTKILLIRHVPTGPARSWRGTPPVQSGAAENRGAVLGLMQTHVCLHLFQTAARLKRKLMNWIVTTGLCQPVNVPSGGEDPTMATTQPEQTITGAIWKGDSAVAGLWKHEGRPAAR